MKQLQINEREREILSILNVHFKLNVPSEMLGTPQSTKKMLDKAWNEYPEVLHDLGIPKFRIAQMYNRILGFNGFVRDFLRRQKVEPFYWVDYA